MTDYDAKAEAEERDYRNDLRKERLQEEIDSLRKKVADAEKYAPCQLGTREAPCGECLQCKLTAAEARLIKVEDDAKKWESGYRQLEEKLRAVAGVELCEARLREAAREGYKLLDLMAGTASVTFEEIVPVVRQLEEALNDAPAGSESREEYYRKGLEKIVDAHDWPPDVYKLIFNYVEDVLSAKKGSEYGALKFDRAKCDCGAVANPLPVHDDKCASRLE